MGEEPAVMQHFFSFSHMPFHCDNIGTHKKEDNDVFDDDKRLILFHFIFVWTKLRPYHTSQILITAQSLSLSSIYSMARLPLGVLFIMFTKKYRNYVNRFQCTCSHSISPWQLEHFFLAPWIGEYIHVQSINIDMFNVCVVCRRCLV